MHLNVDIQICINFLVKVKNITDQIRLSKQHIFNAIFARHCWLKYVGYNVS